MKRSYAEDMICVEFGDEVLPNRERLILYHLGNVLRKNTASLLPRCERLIRRPSDRKCKVVGTDTRTMRRYASLQYYIKYCFIHLPPPCPSSTSPQLRSTFDAASWDDFCQMGVPLYLDSTTSEHLASCLCVKATN